MGFPEVGNSSNLFGRQGGGQKETIGIIDYSYAPLALGDSITAMINMSVSAIDSNSNKTRLIVVADGEKVNWQKHITSVNYYQYVNDILPVYYFMPELSSFHVVYRRENVNPILFRSALHGHNIWPGLLNHLRGKIDYISHKNIISFYKRHGYIPRLKLPKSYEQSTEHIYETYLKNKFVVAVNIRQRKYHADHVKLERDSPLGQWYPFFNVIKKKYPNVSFVYVGGFSEWERELATFENVLIPRILGFGLGEELSILLRANLFMGTSSGFSAAATFSKTPFVITNIEHAFAPFAGIEVGENHPFALEHQTNDWNRETTENLVKQFEEKYRVLA